ncbi:hypothetical protein Acr_17g0001250 [Actinidia rufa]|uniref:Hydroxyproline-rich glycoprotein family protein n=1 Tax=Actinidia rufa TaxID=165716 RepID=A0A7J0G1A0_9ERIC|nr:hypothetical protein Acr_17g0001250 [Actinidia rufa]
MEDKSIAITTTGNGKNKPPLNGERNKKKKGAFTLLKAAMLMVRRRPGGKTKPTVPLEVAASKGMLKKLIGSMRPLHLPDNNHSPPPLPPAVAQPRSPPPTIDTSDNGGSVTMSTLLTLSQDRSLASSSSSEYGSATNLQELDKTPDSRYASAENLLDLNGETDDEDNDDNDYKGTDDTAGDEMIDMKAEEFIAHFYKQMKMQHLESVQRHNSMMMMEREMI